MLLLLLIKNIFLFLASFNNCFVLSYKIIIKQIVSILFLLKLSLYDFFDYYI